MCKSTKTKAILQLYYGEKRKMRRKRLHLFEKEKPTPIGRGLELHLIIYITRTSRRPHLDR